METDETAEEMEATFEQDAAAAEAHRNSPAERNKRIRLDSRHLVEEAHESIKRAEDQRSDDEGDAPGQ